MVYLFTLIAYYLSTTIHPSIYLSIIHYDYPSRVKGHLKWQQQQLPTETQKIRKAKRMEFLMNLTKQNRKSNKMKNETKITQGLELNIINIINN